VNEERFARVGELDLCYQVFGDDQAPALLLVMGLGSQMILWEDEFCAALSGHGLRVVRFDNRDIGRSTILRQARPPTLRQLVLRDPRGAAYSLDDMAADAAGLLDQLGIDAAHVVGASMGGMIAQLIALNHPERVRSLVSIMSTTGNRRVGRPRPNMIPRLIRRRPGGRERWIEDQVQTLRAIGSEVYPTDVDRLRALSACCYDRGHDRAGPARQLAAIQTAADRTAKLKQLRLPATVIHGREDQLVTPSGGRATAQAIPGARLVMLEAMAHDLPRPLWPQILDAILANVADASPSPPART